MFVTEFRNVKELNEYLYEKSVLIEAHVIPLERRFTNPSTKLVTSVITYILIEDRRVKP